MVFIVMTMSSYSLHQFEVYIYIYSIIIFLEFGGVVNVKALTKFVDDGGNVIVTGGEGLGDAIRDYAGECGVEFDSADTRVIDHFNYDKRDTGDVCLITLSYLFSIRQF